MEVLYWAALIVAGLACGFLNTLASSGSAVSLPILMMLGVPEAAANATNRLPVLLGALMASGTFARSGQIDWKSAFKLLPAAVIGAILGTFAAEQIGNRDMGLLITGAVMIALLMLFTQVKKALSHVSEHPPAITWQAVALMFFVGVWLGFIVLDGATYLLLVLMLVCHYALPQANALKSVMLAATVIVAIVMFAGAGDMYWEEGLTMSAGSVVGGFAGAKFSNHVKAKEWAFRLLVLVIVLELVHLAWHYSAPWRAAV